MGWLGDLGNIAGNVLGIKALKDNKVSQEEFAKHGIRWKVRDAEQAGIHPLYALGASTTSFSPVSVGDYAGLGRGIGEFGQDIGRAINSTRTSDERREAEVSAFMQNAVTQSDMRVASAENKEKMDRVFAVDMAHKELQNTLLASQIMRLNQTPNPPFPSTTGSALSGFSARDLADVVGPGLNVSGKSSARPSGTVNLKPSDVTSSDPADRGREAGSTPGLKRYRFGGESGATIDLPGQQLSESLEGLGIFGHIAGPAILGGNFILKKLYGEDKPPQSLLPAGYKWEWSVSRQSWVPTTGKETHHEISPSGSWSSSHQPSRFIPSR